MKRKKILKETDNNSVYKKAFIALNEQGCNHCAPNKGCNKRAKQRKDDLRNWKHYRKHQWEK
ncbi:MAG: hypothetical protein ACOCVF_01925 [bacterium]